jgi:uncharacterized protein YaaW (UPF0174 family)
MTIGEKPNTWKEDVMSVNTKESNARLLSLLGNAPKVRLQSLYNRHSVDPADGIEELVEEICLDGSNTIASLIRGIQGVPYLEIAHDVANKLAVKYNENQKEDAIEYNILGKMLQEFLKNASPEQRAEVDKILDEVGRKYKDKIWKGMSKGALALLINTVGKKVVARVVQRIVVGIAVRQGAKEAGKRAAQFAGYAVPFLNVVMIAWTMVDIAGPAFRKTVPTVIEIALLRLEFGENGRN